MTLYEALLQLVAALFFVLSVAWLFVRPVRRFMKMYFALSWFECVWFVLLGVSREEWSLLWFALASLLKALLLPYATRQLREAPSSLSIGGGWLLFASSLFGLFALWAGRSLSAIYRVNSDAMSAALFLGAAALFSVALRPGRSEQLTSLGALQGSFLLGAVFINTKAPVEWAVLSLLALGALYWRFKAQPDDAVMETQ